MLMEYENCSRKMKVANAKQVQAVDVFDHADHLVDEHGHRFEGELMEGVLEE